MKTSENRWYADVFSGYEKETPGNNRLKFEQLRFNLSNIHERNERFYLKINFSPFLYQPLSPATRHCLRDA